MRLSLWARVFIVTLLAVTSLALFLAVRKGHSAESSFFFIDKWGGLNTFFDSSKLSEGDAQEALNVLTDSGYLEKRPGNVRITQLLNGFPVKYVKEFIGPDASATKYIIAHASNTLYQSSLAGAFTAITTVAANNIDSVSAFGRHYFVDGSQRIMFWNGTTSGTATGSPTGCDLIEFKDERLICAIDSEIRLSSYGADNSWAIAAIETPDSPNSIPIQKDDGENITCLQRTPWGLYIGKGHSSFILKGFDNNSYYLRILDPSIGCADDRTFQMVEGAARWLAQDGVYAWDGAGPPINISKKIEPTVLAIRQLNDVVRSWVLTSAEDFATGSPDTNGTTTTWIINASGYIEPNTRISSDEVKQDFLNGTFGQTTATANGLLVIGNMPFGNSYKYHAVEFPTAATPSIPVRANDGCTFSIAASTLTFLNGASFGAGSLDCAYGWLGQGLGPGLSGGNAQSIIGKMSADSLNSSPYIELKNGSGGAARATIEGATIRYRCANGSGFFDLNTEATSTGTFHIFQVIVSTPENTIAFFRNGNFKSSTTFSACDGTLGASYDSLTFGMLGDNFSGDANLDAEAKFDFVYISTEVIYAGTQSFSGASANSVSTFTSRIFDSNFSTPSFNIVSASMPVVSGAAFSFLLRDSTSPNNDSWDSYEAIRATGIKTTTLNKRYWQYRATGSVRFDFNEGPILDSFSMSSYSTGTFYSPVKSIGNNITSWRTLDATVNSTPSGRISYQVRSATYSFAIQATTPLWTNQTSGQNITVSTAAFFQYNAISSIENTTETARLEQTLVEWNEGNASDLPMASGVKDRRYFLSATTIATSVANDVVFVLEKNGEWVLFNGPGYNSMTLFDNQLIAGDASNNSYIWKTMQPNIYNDDGAAIRSVWVSPDLTIGNPIMNKLVKDGIWIEAARESGSTLNVDYATDKNVTFTTQSINLDITSNTINRRVPIGEGYFFGRYVKFRFINESNDKYFRMHGYGFPYDLEPLRHDE